MINDGYLCCRCLCRVHAPCDARSVVCVYLRALSLESGECSLDDDDDDDERDEILKILDFGEFFDDGTTYRQLLGTKMAGRKMVHQDIVAASDSSDLIACML